MRTISRPTRDDLEELLQVTQRMQVDDRCRADLRTVAATRRLAAEVLESAAGCKADLAMSHPFHVNTLSREYWGGDEGGNGRGTSAGYFEFLDRRLATGSPEDMRYYLLSASMLLHAPYVQGDAGTGGYFDLTAAAQAYLSPLGTLADLAVSSSVLRRYPHLRFNPARYVRWRIHWDDIDREGVPRVSIDGYEI